MHRLALAHGVSDSSARFEGDVRSCAAPYNRKRSAEVLVDFRRDPCLAGTGVLEPGVSGSSGKATYSTLVVVQESAQAVNYGESECGTAVRPICQSARALSKPELDKAGVDDLNGGTSDCVR